MLISESVTQIIFVPFKGRYSAEKSDNSIGKEPLDEQLIVCVEIPGPSIVKLTLLQFSEVGVADSQSVLFE